MLKPISVAMLEMKREKEFIGVLIMSSVFVFFTCNGGSWE
jgi:hypothetical protein